MNHRPVLSQSISSLLVLSAVGGANLTVHAATRTWDGGGVGSTDLGTATNWSTDTLPSVSVPDTALWDGTVAGPLSLVYGNAAFVGVAGDPGLDLMLAATQTAALNIDSGANTNSLRLNNISIATGTGAFSFGDAAGTLNLLLGGAGGQTHTWSNDSSNGATVASDVVLNLDAGAHTLALAGAGNWTFNNVLSGTLDVTKNGGGALTLTGANTYTGGTTLSAGKLNVNNAAALGNTTAGALTISGGILDNTSSAAITTTTAKAMNWNGDFTFQGTNNLNFNLGAVTIGGATGQRTVNVAAGTLSTGLINATAGYGLTKTGAGTLAMKSTTDTSAIAGLLDIQAGTLQIAGNLTANGGLTGAGTIENGGTASKTLFVNSPTDTTFSGTIRDNPANGAARLGLVKRGVGTLNLTGADNTTTNRFAIENGAVRITGNYTTAFAASGNAADIGLMANQTGLLNIDGGNFTASRTAAASINLGTVSGSQGIVRMNGGSFTAANELWIGGGNGSYGSLTMTGGTTNSGNWMAVGRDGAGVVNQSGGTINVTVANYTMGSFTPGFGVTNLSGGAINVTNTAAGQGGFLVGEAGGGILNLSGTGELNISGARGLHIGVNGGPGIVNLNGGIVTTPLVQQGTGAATLNFNGGTLRSSVSSENFFQGLSTAIINAGGAIIDSNGNDITIAQNLIAPLDRGVSAINVATGGTGYLDTPLVRLTGGIGTGATAIANVAGGVVTGFTITNPGSGYADGDVLTATLVGGGATVPATVGTITLTPNATTGGLTKVGAGTLTLSGFNEYTGPTTVTAGTLVLSEFGSINPSSGITINGPGARFVQNNFSDVSPTVTLTNGTLTGMGSGVLSTVNVGAGTGGVIANDPAATGPLSIGALNFNGAATLTLTTANTSPVLMTTGITTNAAGLVTINAANTNGLWTSGTYDLISYSTLGGQGFAAFTSGAVDGLGSRQTANLGNNAGFISLIIGGDIAEWTGAQNGDWTTNTIGGASNWKLQTAGTPTDYVNGDTSLFDDTATGTTALNISTANITPQSVTFNNSTLNYSIASAGGFGIAGGSVVKNGTASLSIGTANTYAGGTTLNNGKLNVNNPSALGTGALIINGGTIDNTSGGPIALSTNNLQTWNAEVVFGGTNALNLGTGNVPLTANRTITTNGTAPLTVGGIISGNDFGIDKNGSGTLTLTGANTYTGTTNINAGTVELSGAINAANTANVGQINVGTGFENATLHISGGTVNATKGGAPSFIVGNSGGGAGAVIIDGGNLTAASELWIAEPGASSGAMTVNAGSVSVGSWLPVGRNGSGNLDVNGGSVTVSGQNVTVGSFVGASGVVTLNGGTMSTTNVAANQGIFIVGEGGTGLLNVSGSAVLNVSGAPGVQLARTATGAGAVNLNGGTINTTAVTKGAGPEGIFNFNGGTLRPTAATTNFMAGLTRAYVNAGGANIDTNGSDITIAQPLIAPTGNGISATGLTVSGSGFISAPQIQIFGGGGTGATANGIIDSNGTLTGITITNPGVNYASDPVFSVVGGGGTGTVSGSPSREPNVGGGLTKSGAGVLTLSGANTYSGQTRVSGGTLALNATGSINGSSSIDINGAGATLVQANPTTPITPTVNVSNGSLDGTGTVNTVVVGAGTGGIVTNGNGGTGMLTIGSLTFSGAGAANINTDGSIGINVTGALTTNGVGTVTLNVPVGLPWETGSTYDLIGFGTLNGALADFVPGMISGLGARQSPTPVLNGSNIAILINGDTPVWTGAANGSWTTMPIGSPFNWKLLTAGTDTEFVNGDQVIFNDTAIGTTAVTISDAAINAAGITFNNSTKDYTISGAFGIASGLVVKNGSGTVTISTPNSYAGGTTVTGGTLILSGNNSFSAGPITVNGGALVLSGQNTYTGNTSLTAGTLRVNNADALGSSVLTINGGVLDNTSGAAVTTTNAHSSNWNGDFTFQGTNDLNLNLGAVTVGGPTGQRTVNVAGGTLSTGVIIAAGSRGLTKTGAGTLAMTSTDDTSSIEGLFDVQAGTFQTAGDLTLNGGLSGAGTIENGGTASKWMYVTSPTDTTFSGTIRDNPNNAASRLGLVKRGPGTLNLTGADNTTTDRFAIEDGAVRITGNYTTAFAASANAAEIGTVADQTGVLNIDGGNFTANRTAAPSINVGTVAGAQGIVRMNGGSFTAASELWIGGGAGAYGALTMSGGTVNSGNWMAVGRDGAGVLNQSGGTLNVTAVNYTMGSFTAGFGETNLSGGTINVTSTAANEGGFLVGEGGGGILNVSGTGELNISGARGLHIGVAGGPGIVNLNGGVVTTPLVQQGSGTATLSFDGGTLRASASSANFLQGLNEAYVHAGGAIFDSNGNDITVAQALLAPTESGVTAVEILDGGSGYLDTPLVTLSGGSGTGATAVAEISGGVLTGIKVTSPGSGYFDGDFEFATITGGGATNPATTGTITLDTVLSGGLTKRGAGTLTLTEFNTYTGSTVVETGTLTIVGSISGSTTIDVQSGAFLNVSGAANGFVVSDTQTLGGRGTVMGNVGTADGAKLSPGLQNPGTLTFTGDVDLTLAVTKPASASLLFDLGAVSDEITLTSGTLTIGTGVLGFGDFTFKNSGGLAQGTYTLFDASTDIVGTLDPSDLSGFFGPGFFGTLQLDAVNHDILLVVIPEPSSASLLALGLGSALGLRRRRRA